jgi:hypothetical protein
MPRPIEIPDLPPADELTGSHLLDELDVILLLHVARVLRADRPLERETSTLLAELIETALYDSPSHAQVAEAIARLGSGDAGAR